MLTSAQLRTQVTFWQSTMEDNYRTMVSLFTSKRYSACLFFGHLVLEKALKILVMQETKEFASRTHNLRSLVSQVSISFTKEELNLLSDVSSFNMDCRYPEDKYDFYKKSTKSFTEPYYKEIKKFYKRLCQEIK